MCNTRWMLLLAAFAAAPLTAQTVSVSSATPNSAAQGTINLNVVIAGKGFKNGAVSQFFVTGTTDTGGVVVNSTTFSGSTQLTANISVSSTATVSGFDVVVQNPDGHSGQGSDIFSVVVSGNANNGACVIPPLPAGFSLVATLNSTSSSGAPLYSDFLGKTARGRLTTVLGQSVIMVVAGGGSTGGTTGTAEVFFLDPLAGTVKDGTWAQPHLTLTTPTPSFYTVTIADVTGDGVPDIVIGARDYGTAWVHVGQGGGAGTLSYPNSPILLRPIQSSTALAVSIAVGDLDNNGGAEIALGVPPSVYLYRWNGSGFTNYNTFTGSDASFGDSVAIGDVTGDSAADLIVGANQTNIGNARGAGRVWIYPSGGSSSFALSTGIKSDGFGSAVAAANLTGAAGGFSDLLAMTSFTATNSRGLIYAGPVTSTSPVAVTLPGAEVDWPQAGLDLADLNGDGITDIIFGAESTGCSGSALVYISGSSAFQQFVLAGPVPPPSGTQPGYGSAASLVPGTKILLVGDKYRTIGGVSNAGQVYVYQMQ